MKDFLIFPVVLSLLAPRISDPFCLSRSLSETFPLTGPPSPPLAGRSWSVIELLSAVFPHDCLFFNDFSPVPHPHEP